MKKSILLLCLSFNILFALAQTPKLEIRRSYVSDKCIGGYLFINDTAMCYTLELPYIGNITDISSIPAGTYEGFIRDDGSKGWRIEFKDVQGRTNVQIHVGNYTSEISGCTLIGMKSDPEKCELSDSKQARKKIEKYFNKYLDTNIRVSYIN